MASRADLDLARKLLGASVLTEPQIREALEIQAELLQKGRSVGLDRILLVKGYLPRDATEALAPLDLLEAQPIPGYRLHRVLGEGGSSVVYAATYLANRASVAVKVLDPVQGLRADLRARFVEEARLLIQLEHENVVAGYEVGCVHGRNWVSMDLIEGPTVLEMIDRAGALDNMTALWIAIQIAKALAYLHRSGLLHRDMKPGNVMIDATGRARIIDLGLVRKLPTAEETAAGEVRAEDSVTVGTVEYISPEQARGRGDLDVRTDIYSLGVTLYHMVVGDVPFHGDTSYEVMAKHILSGLDAQKVKNRRIAPEVHYAITKMMSKEREFRYADCDDVVTDLTRFLPAGGVPRIVLPVSTPPPVAPGSPAPKSPTVPHPRVREGGGPGAARRRRHW